MFILAHMEQLGILCPKKKGRKKGREGGGEKEKNKREERRERKKKEKLWSELKIKWQSWDSGPLA